MNKARPEGIVCDFSQFDSILNPEFRELFDEDAICIRGIAEREPIKVLTLKHSVKISDRDRLPINEPIWRHQEYQYTGETIMTWRETFTFFLDKVPFSPDSIVLEVIRPAYRKGIPLEGVSTIFDVEVVEPHLNYRKLGAKHTVILLTNHIKRFLTEDQFPADEIVKFTLSYIL